MVAQQFSSAIQNNTPSLSVYLPCCGVHLSHPFDMLRSLFQNDECATYYEHITILYVQFTNSNKSVVDLNSLRPSAIACPIFPSVSEAQRTRVHSHTHSLSLIHVTVAILSMYVIAIIEVF